MRIDSFQKFSLSDFPGCIAALVFVGGCNFRCPYCHNGQLVMEDAKGKIGADEVLEFLRKRKGKLEGVAITGGEPTLQDSLVSFCGEIKRLGYKIKVDTNGTQPRVLAELIENRLVDYIAMDIKAPFNKYPEIAGKKVDSSAIEKNIRQIMDSPHLDYEFRTTVVRNQLTGNDIVDIAKQIKGANRYILQKFIPATTLDPAFKNQKTYTNTEFKGIIQRLKPYVQECFVR